MAIQMQQQRGITMGPQSGPVRIKKRAGFFQSIFGVFIGLLLVLASPFVMWGAGSQDTAGDFEKAEVVSASSSAVGYISVRDVPSYATADGGNDCYLNNCIHEVTSFQHLVTKQELVCSNNVQESETLHIVRRNGSELDEETGVETPCYDVERDSWDEISSEQVNYNVALGAYTVEPSMTGIYLDTQETIVNTDFDELDKAISRTVYKSFLMPSQLLVAGESDGSTITSPAKKPMVISQYDHAGTLESLKAQDRANMLFLWIGAFMLLFIGFSMMFGPIEWATRMFGKIPTVGPMVRSGSRAMISLLAFVMAVAVWVVELVLVTILQNIWLVALVILIIGGVLFWLGKRNKGAVMTN